MAYLDHNHEDISEVLHGLVAKYHQEDIYTCDVNEPVFRRSPIVDGATTSLLKVILTYSWGYRYRICTILRMPFNPVMRAHVTLAYSALESSYEPLNII